MSEGESWLFILFILLELFTINVKEKYKDIKEVMRSHITGFVTIVTRRMPYVYQKLHTRPERLRIISGF
jgi:hypothetical protein